jgi:hypothetical protein
MARRRSVFKSIGASVSSLPRQVADPARLTEGHDLTSEQDRVAVPIPVLGYHAHDPVRSVKTKERPMERLGAPDHEVLLHPGGAGGDVFARGAAGRDP